MYTVELEYDGAVVTSMSDNDAHEDVEVLIDEKGEVFLRQFQEYKNEYEVICMSFQQLMDITTAVHSPEGMYKIQKRVKW
jgi:hypothetical protein